MGISLPADSREFMLIEDLYGSIEKIEKHIEFMANNRINIEFLRKQVDKIMEDIEKLKVLIEKLFIRTATKNDRNVIEHF